MSCAMAVLMRITFLVFLLEVLFGHISDSTSVLLIAHACDDVDTLTEHMFARGVLPAYAVLMSGTQPPTTDIPSDQA